VFLLRDHPHRLPPDVPGPLLLVGDERQVRDQGLERHRLSEREFPDAKWFSPRNLKYMGAFARAYPDGACVQ